MAIRGIGSRDGQGVADDGLDLFLSALTRGTDEDKAVYASAEDTVALVTANLQFCGVVRAIDQKNANASVQMDGWVELYYTGSDPSPEFGYMYLVGGATAGQIKLATEGEIKTVSITVAQGAASGVSAADPTLVGGTVVGIVPSSNQDQFVDDTAIAGDGAITVTLGANATAANTYDVMVLKAAALRPKKYFVSGVDTTNKIITLKL